MQCEVLRITKVLLNIPSQEIHCLGRMACLSGTGSCVAFLLENEG